MPDRIRLSRRKGWRLPENAMSVARPGPFGNPFVVGRDGTSAECVTLYRHMLAGYFALTSGPTIEAQRQARQTVLDRLPELRGKPLACWCSLDGPCHADVLLELANA